ncbi:MAG: carboxypeptidase regulatory-like domain-containing protein [bacterium]|nr:carboxypeptidase regulatory-like domain-containing protein [bacterium]
MAEPQNSEMLSENPIQRLGALVLVLLLVLPITAHAAGYKETRVENGGSITGKLSFSGELPADAVEMIAVNKNPEVCGEGYREVVWVDVENGALRGAFVYLHKIKKGKAWSPPDGGKYMINQKGCRFRPWAQVVRQGDIHIKHSDQGVQHNINMVELIGVDKGRAVERPLINRNQPDPGEAIEQIKTVRAPHIAMNCQVHNFMFGFMMAPKSPYAVAVEEDGSYVLDNVPAGKYTLKSWHPRLGVQKKKITVPANGEVVADFEYTKDSASKKRRRPRKTKAEK